jgi:hypothetical protein
MLPDVLILGQGLAGTLLAWECERAGLSFRLADPGHAGAASLAAAGVVNPVTGRRLVKSWRIDDLRPAAREAYLGLESALGVPLWRELRVRRIFTEDAERSAWARKVVSRELAPYAVSGDADGCWIEGAARVDLPQLLAAARRRWQAAGQLRAEPADPIEALARHACVIDCRGVVTAASGAFSFVPWEFSRGEALDVRVDGLDPDVIVHRRHALVPLGGDRAWLGATHVPGTVETASPGRAVLEASAAALLAGRTWRVAGQWSGVRVNLPDKRPVAGRHPREPRLGVCGALGSKGVLWAPLLARAWVEHLRHGRPFDPGIDVARFSASLSP